MKKQVLTLLTSAMLLASPVAVFAQGQAATNTTPATSDQTQAVAKELPAEIHGSYSFGNEKFEISAQQITYNGKIYDVESCMVQKISEQVDRYSVAWNVDKFKERYPGEEVPGPQAISFDFDKSSKTIVATGIPAQIPVSENQETPPASTDSTFAGLPAEIQGKHTLGNEAMEITSQQIIYKGKIYDVDSYTTEKISDQVDRYSIVWNVDKFKERYPNVDVPGPQAISFDFNKSNKTITESGTPAQTPEMKNQQNAPVANASKQTPAPASDQKKADQAASDQKTTNPAAGDQKKAGNLAADQKKTQPAPDKQKNAETKTPNKLVETKEVKKTVKPANQQADPQKKNIINLLPRTGASSSILLVGLGVSALGLGIGLSKRQ